MVKVRTSANFRERRRPDKKCNPETRRLAMSLNHGQTVLFVLGICLGLSVMGSDAFAVQTQQVNQQLVQAVTGVENFLMGPISKLVIYSVFTLSFLAALVKQSVPGAIFAVGGALAYHQVTGWVNQTFTLLI